MPIHPITRDDLPRVLAVLHAAFASVTEKFNITRENCPMHTAYMPLEKLQRHWDSGFHMFGYYVDDDIVGYVSLEDKGGGAFELHNLAVLPEYRHCGYGSELVRFCMDQARDLNGTKLFLGFIDENELLKAWYIRNGFTYAGTEKFEHLPFTAGYMEWEVR